MEVVAEAGRFGPKQTNKRSVGRPKHYTIGRHKLTSVYIISVEGLDDRLKAAQDNPERLQEVVESIHTDQHIYWVSGISDGDYWEMRIGPLTLPFVTRALSFYIEVERRKTDDAPSKTSMWSPALRDSPNDPPRRVFPGSFALLTKYFPYGSEPQSSSKDFRVMWPPSLHSCIEAVDASGMRPRGLEKLYWKASDHYSSRPSTAVCSSIADIEHDAHGLNLEVKTSLLLTLRELMLGPQFFEMCRYFESKDLIRMPPFFFKKFCSDLPKHSDAIVMAFLRNPRSGRRFVDGSALVRFIDEKVNRGLFVNYLLPDFASRDCWMALSLKREKEEDEKRKAAAEAEALSKDEVYVSGSTTLAKKRRGISMSVDSTRTLINPASSTSRQQSVKVAKKQFLQRTASVPTFTADPESKIVIANWFSTLRGVYYNILGADYLEKGAMYVKWTFSEQELEYGQYLVDKAIIKAYPNFKPRGAPLIARHWTEEDCGPMAETLYAGKTYYIHPFLDAKSTLSAIKNTVNGLWASYETGLQNYTRMKVKNALFENGISTYTYYEEYTLLEQAYVRATKTPVSDDIRPRLTEMYNRLTVIANRERSRLESHEESFLKNRMWSHNQKDILKEELLSRDAVPPTVASFWEELDKLSIGNYGEYRYAQKAFNDRFDTWVRSKGAEMGLSDQLKAEVKDMLNKYLGLAVVIFDMPETNIGERRFEGNAPDVFRAMVREVADMSFGPGEIRAAPLTTQESLLFKRRVVFPNPSKKLVCLHEVEKWTIQDLQEVLSACFFDWEGQATMNPPSTTHVLWIFADRTAIDLGALSALVHMSKIETSGLSPLAESSFVDLRSACVKESETAGLAVRLQNEEFYTSTTDSIDCVQECLYFSEFDEDSVDVELIVEDTGEHIPAATAELVQISMKDLPNLRYGISKPDYAKVNLMELDNWRQIYTLMCYVRVAIVLVGPKQTLEVLLKASRNEFFFSEEARSKYHHSASDVLYEPGTNAWGRLIYKPSSSLDLFTSFANYVVPDPPTVVTRDVYQHVPI